MDYTILLQRLEKELSVTGTVLSWIKSYLPNHTQWVVIDDPNTDGARLDKISLSFGVPQGSVLSPILFTLYTCPLGCICKKHNVLYHLYADDQQIYISSCTEPTQMQPDTVGPQESCLSRIESCISEIIKWMTHNMLKHYVEKKNWIHHIWHKTATKEGHKYLSMHRKHRSSPGGISKELRVLHGQTTKKHYP